MLYVGGSQPGPALSQKRGRGESCERTSGIFSIRLNDGIHIVSLAEWEWDCIWWPCGSLPRGMNVWRSKQSRG